MTKTYFIATKFLEEADNGVKLSSKNSINPSASSFLDIANYAMTKNGIASGTVTLDGDLTASKEIAVTLPTAKDDTTYQVLLTVEEGTISSADQGKLQAFVKTGTKATTGFTIELYTELAAGEDVKVNWMVIG